MPRRVDTTRSEYDSLEDDPVSRTIHIFHDYNYEYITPEELQEEMSNIASWFCTEMEDDLVIETHPTYRLEETRNTLKQMSFNSTDLIILNIMSNDAKYHQGIWDNNRKQERKRRNKVFSEIKQLQENIVKIIREHIPADGIVWLEAPPLLTTARSSIQQFNELSKRLMEREGGNYIKTLITSGDIGRNGMHVKGNGWSRRLVVQSMAAAVLNHDPTQIYHTRFDAEKRIEEKISYSSEAVRKEIKKMWTEQQSQSSPAEMNNSATVFQQQKKIYAQPPTEMVHPSHPSSGNQQRGTVAFPPMEAVQATQLEAQLAQLVSIPMGYHRQQPQYEPIRYDRHGRRLPIYNNKQLIQRSLHQWQSPVQKHDLIHCGYNGEPLPVYDREQAKWYREHGISCHHGDMQTDPPSSWRRVPSRGCDQPSQHGFYRNLTYEEIWHQRFNEDIQEGQQEGRSYPNMTRSNGVPARLKELPAPADFLDKRKEGGATSCACLNAAQNSLCNACL